MDWQPIETAPKDGTVIDVWTQFGREANVRWAKGAWRSWALDEFDGMGWVKLDEPGPTHWMPLPAPPKL